MNGKLSDAYLLSGTAVVLPTLGLLAPLGTAPLLAIVALALLAAAPRRIVTAVGRFPTLAIILLLLALWGTLSSSWSIIPGHSLFEAGRLVLLSAAGLVIVGAALGLDEADRTTLGRAGLLGLLIGLAVMASELLDGFALRHLLSSRETIVLPAFDRGAMVLSLTCWIPILYLVEMRRRAAAIIVFLLTAAIIWQLISLSSFLALLVAAAVFALALWWPRVMAALLGAGVLATALILPFVPPTRDTVLWLREAMPGLRGSAAHRLIIWRFASDRFHERPLFGWGMDASRALPGGKTQVVPYMGLPSDFPLTGAVMPLHPHDALLQWWLELGVVGAALGIALIFYVLWHAASTSRLTRVGKAGALAVIAAALMPLLLSFGVWQAWWQATLWLMAALAVAIVAKPGAAGAQPSCASAAAISPTRR